MTAYVVIWYLRLIPLLIVSARIVANRRITRFSTGDKSKWQSRLNYVFDRLGVRGAGDHQTVFADWPLLLTFGCDY